jgi:anhydro-N-acetylmuramic acid kinase
MPLTRAIGLMSGTSLDGVDVALIETDGEVKVVLGPNGSIAYSEADRALLRQALVDAANLTERTQRPGCLGEAEALITTRHAEAVETFLAREKIDPASIDFIGFHGQTVLHRPQLRLTVQLGDGPALAQRLGLAVVYDFRGHDVECGGQGAPLVPIFHKALVDAAGLNRPVALINIGGVANVSFLAPNEPPIAFDCGPGNALLDDFMHQNFAKACDFNGELAALGEIDGAALNKLLDHPFFTRPWPKSLDRNEFSSAPVVQLTAANAAATLTAFTAETIARSFRDLPKSPKLAIICGGGAKNPSLMAQLLRRLPCGIEPAEHFGWSTEAMEAQAFAYLAARQLKKLPITFPTTTGVAAPLTGGRLAFA